MAKKIVKEVDNILAIQNYLMKTLERLSDDDIMSANGKAEVARANAKSQTALTFLKSCNLKLQIDKAANSSKTQRNELSKYVGIIVENEEQ